MEQKQIIRYSFYLLFCIYSLSFNGTCQNLVRPKKDTLSPKDSMVVIKKKIMVESVDVINIYLKTYTDISASSFRIFNYYPDFSVTDSNYKKTHTNNNYGLQFGISQGLLLNKLFLSVSVLLKSHSEQFIYCDPNGLKDTTYNVSNDYTIRTIKARGINEVFNYQYLKIPILIGYVSTYKKYFFSIQTGIDFNFLLKAKGKLVSDQDVLTISRKQYTKYPLGLIAGLSGGYKLWKEYFLFIEPRYVYALTPVLSKETGVNCKASSLSVFVGLRKYF